MAIILIICEGYGKKLVLIWRDFPGLVLKVPCSGNLPLSRANQNSWSPKEGVWEQWSRFLFSFFQWASLEVNADMCIKRLSTYIHVIVPFYSINFLKMVWQMYHWKREEVQNIHMHGLCTPTATFMGEIVLFVAKFQKVGQGMLKQRIMVISTLMLKLIIIFLKSLFYDLTQQWAKAGVTLS